MIPILETERLILRPYVPSDIERIVSLFSDKKIAETTLIVPHPFSEEKAVSWIGSHQDRASKGEAFIFAVTTKTDNNLIGNTMIRIDKEHNRGELSYWFGVPYWGQGFATEAANIVVEFGFKELNLNRIIAAVMAKNPGSMKVMDKIGLKYEGTFNQHVLKWGKYEDLAYYGLLKDQFDKITEK